MLKVCKKKAKLRFLCRIGQVFFVNGKNIWWHFSKEIFYFFLFQVVNLMLLFCFALCLVPKSSYQSVWKNILFPNTLQVEIKVYKTPSMIHSARPTFTTVAITIFTCFVLRDFEKWGHGRTPRGKIVIATGRDCGSASWIKNNPTLPD